MILKTEHLKLLFDNLERIAVGIAAEQRPAPRAAQSIAEPCGFQPLPQRFEIGR
jgi:hypothetical protein